MDRERDQAQQKLNTARMFQESRKQVVDEMEWLSQNEPGPVASQDVQTQLQQLCEREAKSAGLTPKTQKPLPTDTTGANFHRAKIQLTVTGDEKALYLWFDRLIIPEQFRTATSIRISPNKEDDTQIDCTATIEQWFVPLPPT
jgi:hypothetical protein